MSDQMTSTAPETTSTPTATEPSAPTSTAEVAAQVIESYNSAEAPASEDTDTAPVAARTPTPTPEPAAPAEPKPLSEAEQLLHDAGYKAAKKPDGRDNYIPHSKVVKIIENGLKQGKGEFGARFAALDQEAATLRSQVAELRQAISTDPDAFIRELASADARYAKYLQQAQQQAQQQAAEIPSDRPEPDVDLGNGQRTYSVEGVERLAAWKAQQLINERFKPIEEREKAAKAQQERAEIERGITERSQATLQQAQEWPLFGPLAADGSLNEVQAAVLEELRKDSEAAQAAGRRPSLSLEGAYIKVTAGKLTTDRNALRAEILKELQGAPRGTAVPRVGGEAPKAPGTTSTAEIAARTLARLSGAA